MKKYQRPSRFFQISAIIVCVRDSLEPILRMVMPNNKRSQFFPDRFYLGVRQSNLGRIKIYIKDSSFNNAVALKGEIQLTLHLKKEN